MRYEMTKKAGKRLPDPGRTERENMEWVVRFLQEEVETLTLQQLKDILSDIQHLAKLTLSDRSQPFARWEIVADEKRTTTTPIGNVYREARLRETLTDYQKILKKKIDELCRSQRTVVQVSPSQAFATFPFEIVTGRPYPALFVQTGHIDEVFLAFDFRLVFILQACADRLRICRRKKCEQVFLRTQRSDKEFCSKSCGGAVRAARKRDKDKTARQAMEHAKQLRARKPIKQTTGRRRRAS